MIANYWERIRILILLLLFSISTTQIDAAAPASLPNTSESPSPRHLDIDDHWGGHLKINGAASWPTSDSLFWDAGTETLYDGHAELRVKNRLFFGDWGDLDTHYEIILAGGDTRRKVKSLDKLYPTLFVDGIFSDLIVEDDRRFMDLTGTVDEDGGSLLYHRLDRLALTLAPEWGTVRIGRQAITWGNGLLFNPMDLFNPFSPADIERDYKIGDDMVSTQFSVEGMEEFQFLYVPRRNPISGEVEWGQSSLAGKLHFFRDTTEFDIMIAEHYRDALIGLGSAGYLGDAAWRLDGTWTSSDGDEGYLSIVANMDYSWIWLGRNFYGFVEFFFNGLSHNHYSDFYADSEIASRIERGELFTLGRTYLSGHIRVELHPLFNVYVTVIENLADPSGGIQPRAVWDMAEDVQVTFGAALYHGRKGTEFGGVTIPGTGLIDKPSNNAFFGISYFF